MKKFINSKFRSSFYSFSISLASPSRLLNLFVLLILLQTFWISSCSSGDLSRTQAQKMIIESDDFKKPAVIELIQGNFYVGRNKGAIESKSETEPEAEAVQRRIAAHYAANPQMEVAAHFGLVEAQVKRTNDKPDPRTAASSYWYFDERYFITEKGRKMWEALELPVNETSIPIGEKEFLEVTGITKQSDTTVQVDYKWQWKPNEIGRTLDSSTEEFNRLPEKIRNDLTAPEGMKSKNQTLTWSGEHQGKAIFQKYDDGWRLTSAGLN